MIYPIEVEVIKLNAVYHDVVNVKGSNGKWYRLDGVFDVVEAMWEEDYERVNDMSKEELNQIVLYLIIDWTCPNEIDISEWREV